MIGKCVLVFIKIIFHVAYVLKRMNFVQYFKYINSFYNNYLSLLIGCLYRFKMFLMLHYTVRFYDQEIGF